MFPDTILVGPQSTKCSWSHFVGMRLEEIGFPSAETLSDQPKCLGPMPIARTTFRLGHVAYSPLDEMCRSVKRKPCLCDQTPRACEYPLFTGMFCSARTPLNWRGAPRYGRNFRLWVAIILHTDTSLTKGKDTRQSTTFAEVCFRPKKKEFV